MSQVHPMPVEAQAALQPASAEEIDTGMARVVARLPRRNETLAVADVIRAVALTTANFDA